MINEEILCFIQVISAFQALSQLLNNNRSKQKELKNELDAVIANPQLIYGVVKKTTKDEKVNNLKFKLEKCISDVETTEQLYSLIIGYISDIEIPNFRMNHSLKWSFLLNHLAEERKNKVKAEEHFWQNLREFTMKP